MMMIKKIYFLCGKKIFRRDFVRLKAYTTTTPSSLLRRRLRLFQSPAFCSTFAENPKNNNQQDNNNKQKKCSDKKGETIISDKVFYSATTNFAALHSDDGGVAEQIVLRRRTLVSPKRETNYSPHLWANHKATTRHWRHLLRLPLSATLHRVVWPNLIIVALSSFFVTWFNVTDATISLSTTWLGLDEIIRIDEGTLPDIYMPFKVSSLALGLLVTFRTNQSSMRFVEARTTWGEVINASRDLARQTLMWLPCIKDNFSTLSSNTSLDDSSYHGRNEVHTLNKDIDPCKFKLDVDESTAVAMKWRSPDHQRIGQLLKAFAIVLNFHLTTNGGHHDIRCRDKNASEMCTKEIYAELLTVWPEGVDNNTDFQSLMHTYVKTNDHVPLQVLSLLAGAIRDNEVDSVFAREMDQQLLRLNRALGTCERLLRTPMVTPFTRHTSRFLIMWCNMLPLAMFPYLGLATIPAALLVSYALLGIEDIGVQIEEPFDVLPLRQYCQAVHLSVDQILAEDPLPIELR